MDSISININQSVISHSVLINQNGVDLTPYARTNHTHGGLSLINLSGTSASNGLTLSANTAGGGGAALQGSGTYTQNTGTIQFANSNGITFGLTGNQMTASHDGLTTAMASNAGSNFMGVATAGTNVSLTANSSGLSLSIPNYLTTAQPVGAYLTTAMASENTSLFQYTSGTSAITSLAARTGVTTATTSGVDLKGTLNSNGLNLGVPAWLTAATGGGGVGLNTAGTNITWTVNSSGISINNPAWLTTAMASNAGSNFMSTSERTNYLNTSATSYLESSALQFTSGMTKYAGILTTGITGGSATINSQQIQINLPAYLTTAAASNHSHGNPTLALTNLSGTTASASNGLTLSLSAAAPSGGGVGLNTAGTNITWTVNSSGISINNPAWLTTAMASNAGSNFMSTSERTNYLNTSATSYLESTLLQFTSGMTKYAGILTTGITGGSATINSQQIQINLPAYLTTAANSTHSHGNPTLALTNLSGTTASASNGLTLSLSGPNPGILGIAGSTNSTVTNGTVQFANSNGVSFGLSGSTMTAQMNAVGSVYFSNIAGFSWSSSVNGVSTTIYLVTA